MKKKFAISVISLCVAAVLLAGCQKSDKEMAANGEESYQITWYNIGNPSVDDNLVFNEVNKLLAKKINASLNVHLIRNSEYADKIKMLLSANESFDLCFISGTMDFASYAAKDAFLPLDELLKDYGKDILRLISDEIFNAVRVNGKVYAVPPLKDWATEPIMRYHTQLAEKYNFDMDSVKTLDDLSSMLQTIKDNEPTVMPVLTRGNAAMFRMVPFEAVAGSPIGAFKIGEYDKIVNQYDTPEAKEYFRLSRDWYEKGFLRRDAASATNDNEYYASEKFFLNYAESLPYTEDAFNVKADVKRSFIYNMYPVTLTTRSIQGALQAFSRTSQNPQRVMEFLNLLYTDAKIKNLLTHGIEGKHYIIGDDGRYSLPEGIESTADTNYNPATEYCIGNRFLSPVSKSYPLDKWDKWSEFNDGALKSGALGFCFDGSDYTSEIAAMQNIYTEYLPSLLVGAVDPDIYLPRAIEKLKVAGMDTVLAEMQRQYDEWRAK